ncbi:MAG: sugar phosphate isomerase/epimerase [Akkermansiaceae bacterium]|nr:sugar phosphate isomerase/epimerase [Akkermansiaceae bacterium]MCP5551308.1 sugar phosphate isomerase/epimerase [Akkermansiaceae bacterium]
MASPRQRRRRFLKTAALAAAGAALPIVRAASPARETCGLGIGTYGLQKLPLPEAIDLVADTGYDCVEITVFSGFTGDPAALTSEVRKSLRKRMEDKNLRLSALMADLHPSADDARHREQTEALRRMIALGRDLSPAAPPLIQTVLGGKDWEKEKNLFRDRLGDWLRVVTEEDAALCVKPHRGHAMSRPADAAWLIGQLGNSSGLGMVYDYSHYAFRGMDIVGTVAESLPLTRYVAVKDAIRTPEGKVVFALAGEGKNWDHADILKAFHAGGYRGDFCCEVSSQIWKGDPGHDFVAATKRCHANLAAAFERAGVPRG